MKKILFLVILALLVFAVMPAAAQDLPYAGVTVNLLTFTGPQVAEPLQRRAPDFEKLTGAKINIVTVPNSDLFNTMVADQSTGTNSYQAFVFAPQWIADLTTPGYLEDLTPYVNADKDIQWDDVGNSSAISARLTMATFTPFRSTATSTWFITGRMCSKTLAWTLPRRGMTTLRLPKLPMAKT